MISRLNDIITQWYHSQYQMISVSISWMISCMISISISCLYDIRALIINFHVWYKIWYQRWYQVWYRTWWRCLYPQPKTRCIERCRSRALQVQVQDVQNQRRRSSALLDEAGSSSASDASRPAMCDVVCPSHLSADVLPPTKLPPSSSSSNTLGVWREKSRFSAQVRSKFWKISNQNLKA